VQATTASQKLFFVYYAPGSAPDEDPVTIFLRNNQASEVRCSLFDFLLRANKLDILKKVLFFDGKDEVDISNAVGSELLLTAALKAGVCRWPGPMGPFPALYLYGPILWRLGGAEVGMQDPWLSEILDKAMPAWAMPTDEQAKRTHIPSAVQEAVYLRDGGKCKHCGTTRDLQFDHILPHSKGGNDTVDNLQLLCRKCNLSKGSGF
jgi:hypothetical protein